MPPVEPARPGPADPDTRPGAGPAALDDDRLHHEQVAELYRTVTIGVLTAAVGAVVLAVALIAEGGVAWRKGALWALAVCACAACHLALRWGYARARRPAEDWRLWAGWFTAVSLAEGIVWGWGAVSLAPADRLDLQLLVHVVAYAVAAGAIPAFGSFLPAYYAIFLPIVLPYMVWSATLSGVIHHAAAFLSFVFMLGMAGLGWRANRNFGAALRLRFEKERLAEDLRRQKELAEEANLAKSRFLAAASHDLRQPVHALSLFVGALQGLAMEDEARRLVGHIEGSVDALDSLFTSLLDISRLDAGIVQASPQSFPIQPLLERICRDLTGEAAAKGLRVVLHPSSAVVHTDAMLLERILRNLVSNAVRYTDRGRVVVGCRRGARLRLQVGDTGRGIPAALQAQVFQEFFQIDNPERDRSRGLGLGLAIVKRLATLLALELELRSVPGRGSLFSVAVPVAARADAPAPAASAPPSAATARGLVLVIDDETAIQEAMRSLLAGWGHSVVAASSGAEMLERVAATPRAPDLIISDYRLRAGENGIDVIRRLQEEFNDDIPALLVTGDTAPERLAEAEASGLVLLHKPVPNAALRAAIDALLRERAEAAPALAGGT